MAIVTSQPPRFAIPIVEAVGLRRFFEHVEGVDPGKGEAKDVTLRRAKTRTGDTITCSRPVVIGDRAYDILAGVALGIGTIGVTWGNGTEEELVASGANLMAHTPEQFPHQLRDLVAQ